MTYTEKLKQAKDLLRSKSYDKETIVALFPELEGFNEEDEDENIRKSLLDYLSYLFDKLTVATGDNKYLPQGEYKLPDFMAYLIRLDINRHPIQQDLSVDLGLPSGTRWATCNIGANSPEEYGDYFAWGETEPHYNEGSSLANPCNDWRDGYSSYYWDSYKWVKEGGSSWRDINKYTFADDQTDANWYDGDTFVGDNKTELDDEDDVAVQLLGGDWQMPTNDDWEELIENCTWTWTTENGVNGYKVTSKKEGYTDKYIFLPAAGYRCGANLYDAGPDGYYWSRSLYPSSSYDARYLYFGSGGVGTYNSFRYNGLSVRAVQPFIFKVTFDSNGGSAVDAQDVKSNAKATKPADPKREGYIFKGWYNGEEPFDFSLPINGDITLTARWKDASAGGAYTVAIPEAVDLGLSVNWASFNIGATAPEEYGDYFAWGETEPHYADGHSQDRPCNDWRDGYSSYYWDSYKWVKEGGDSWTDIYKYTVADGQKDDTNWYDGDTFVGDGKTELEDADDVATKLLGNDWQMPTIEQQEELLDNCYWVWTDNYKGESVNGYIVYKVKDDADKGKINGTPAATYDVASDVHIFLPAAGFRGDANLSDAGSYGFYWSRSLAAGYSDLARSLYFSSGNVSAGYDYCRNYGQSVRAVLKKSCKHF